MTRRPVFWTVSVTVVTGANQGLAWDGKVNVAAPNSASAAMRAKAKVRELAPELALMPGSEIRIERMTCHQ